MLLSICHMLMKNTVQPKMDNTVISPCDKKLSLIFHFILVSFLSFLPLSSPLRDWLRFHKRHDCCLLNLTHLNIVWWIWCFFFFFSYMYVKAILNQLFAMIRLFLTQSDADPQGKTRQKIILIWPCSYLRIWNGAICT